MISRCISVSRAPRRRHQHQHLCSAFFRSFALCFHLHSCVSVGVCVVEQVLVCAQMLQAKVRKLEHLLTLKDIRIDDLQRRLDGVRPTASQVSHAPRAPIRSVCRPFAALASARSPLTSRLFTFLRASLRVQSLPLHTRALNAHF